LVAARIWAGAAKATLPKAEETKPKTIPVRNVPVQGQIGQGSNRHQNGHSQQTIEGESRPATAATQPNR
jgi:hypothetical protein